MTPIETIVNTKNNGLPDALFSVESAPAINSHSMILNHSLAIAPECFETQSISGKVDLLMIPNTYIRQNYGSYTESGNSA